MKQIALTFALGVWLAGYQAEAQAVEPSRTGIDAFMRATLTELKLPGAAVIVARKDGRGGWTDVVRGYYGSYTPATVEPVASATKWYTAATIASVAETGRLRLDDPVSRYLPGVPADKAGITVRQTLSHISGLATFSPLVERQNADLEQSARNVLAAPLVGSPGKVMSYSGTAMQVASRAAEISSGQPWRTLFQQRIAGPLGLTQTSYGDTQEGAPVTGGGLRTTPSEMEVFTRMLANEGEDHGVRVLNRETVRDLARLVTRGASQMSVPGPAREYPGMGTGEWCQAVDPQDRCTSVASIGAFGTYAWVDYARGLYGVFFVRTRLGEIMPKWNQLRLAVEAIAAAEAAPHSAGRINDAG